MAVKNYTGFEFGDTALYTVPQEAYPDYGGGTLEVQSSIVKHGSCALHVSVSGYDQSGVWLCVPYQSAGGTEVPWIGMSFDTCVAGAYFYFPQIPSEIDAIIDIWDRPGSLEKIAVIINGDGTLSVYGTDEVEMQKGTTVLSPETWYLIEVKVGKESSPWEGDGPYELRINGVTELAGFGFVSSGPTAGVMFGRVAAYSDQNVEMYIDDCVIDDSSFIGEREVSCLVPNGPGYYQGWQDFQGTLPPELLWTTVDEIPKDNDTTCVVARVIDSLTSISLQHIPCASAGIDSSRDILSVKAFSSCRGIYTAPAAVLLRSNGTDSFGTPGLAGRGYVGRSRVENLDFGSMGPWTIASVDALETGLKAGSIGFGDGAFICTQCLLMVLHVPGGVPPSFAVRIVAHAGI